jgi:hypothetical protein
VPVLEVRAASLAATAAHVLIYRFLFPYWC